MKNKIVVGLFALAACLALPFTAIQVHAQQSSAATAAPRIDGFDVEPVLRPAPGNELVFTLYGSPGATAAVSNSGATGGLALAEIEAGVYQGTYTIRARDKITTASTATANLRLGNRVASALLRLENGGVQTISYEMQPPFVVGARVRVENGTLVVAAIQ